MCNKSMKMVFMASIISLHFFLFKNNFWPKFFFVFAEINLTTWGPLYTCHVVFADIFRLYLRSLYGRISFVFKLSEKPVTTSQKEHVCWKECSLLDTCFSTLFESFKDIVTQSFDSDWKHFNSWNKRFCK